MSTEKPRATPQSLVLCVDLVCRFTSAFAGVCKQNHSTEKLSITFQHVLIYFLFF